MKPGNLSSTHLALPMPPGLFSLLLTSWVHTFTLFSALMLLTFLPVETAEGGYNFWPAVEAIFSGKIGEGTSFVVLLAMATELLSFLFLVTDQLVHGACHFKLLLFYAQPQLEFCRGVFHRTRRRRDKPGTVLSCCFHRPSLCHGLSGWRRLHV